MFLLYLKIDFFKKYFRYGVGKPRDPEAYRMQRAELAASITIDKIHRLQVNRKYCVFLSNL